MYKDKSVFVFARNVLPSCDFRTSPYRDPVERGHVYLTASL